MQPNALLHPRVDRKPSDPMHLRPFLLSLLAGGAALAVVFAAPPGWPCTACHGNQALLWHGATVWRTQGAPALGGISGLVMDPDGRGFLALSDRVRLLSGQMHRAPETDALRAVTLTGQEALLNPKGAPLTPFNSDAEALARGADGMLFAGFEGLSRVLAYPAGDGTARRATRLHAWDRFRDLWGNDGIEALAPLPEDTADTAGLVAITQAGQSYIWRGGTGPWQAGFALPDMDSYEVSGADLGPDGALWVLERRRGWTGFTTRIRRFSLEGSTLGTGRVLLEGHIGWRENFEAISLWCDPKGRTVVTLVSDDGFSHVQRTVLAEFTWQPDQTPDPVCAKS